MCPWRAYFEKQLKVGTNCRRAHSSPTSVPMLITKSVWNLFVCVSSNSGWRVRSGRKRSIFLSMREVQSTALPSEVEPLWMSHMVGKFSGRSSYCLRGQASYFHKGDNPITFPRKNHMIHMELFIDFGAIKEITHENC